jgi:hypothetical protein
MNIQDSIEKLQEFFSKYLVDPLSERSSQWIYTDEGRIELDKSPYPKILLRVADTPSNKELNSIGSFRTLNTDLIEMHIKAKFGNHYGYGEEKYTAKEFVSFIAKKVEELLKDEELQDELDDKGFHSVLVEGDNFRNDREQNPTYILRIQTKYID